MVNFQSLIYLSAALDVADPFLLLEKFPLVLSGVTRSWFPSPLTTHPFSVSLADASHLPDFMHWLAKTLVLRHFLCPFAFLGGLIKGCGFQPLCVLVTAKLTSPAQALPMNSSYKNTSNLICHFIHSITCIFSQCYVSEVGVHLTINSVS